VRRLFAESRAAEQAHFSKTAFFPIMYAVALKRSVWEAHRGCQVQPSGLIPKQNAPIPNE